MAGFAITGAAPWRVLSGVCGIGANLLLTIILYAVELPYLNSHMCPALSFDAIFLLMEGVAEPIFMFKGSLFPVSMLLLGLGFPFVRQSIFSMECSPPDIHVNSNGQFENACVLGAKHINIIG
jgi:hypothetical protein